MTTHSGEIKLYKVALFYFYRLPISVFQVSLVQLAGFTCFHKYLVFIEPFSSTLSKFSSSF